jgi:WD40 repeat protein
MDMDFSPDSRLLACPSLGDGTLLWDLATGQSRHLDTGMCWRILFDASGKAVYSRDKTGVRKWPLGPDLTVGPPEIIFPDHPEWGLMCWQGEAKNHLLISAGKQILQVPLAHPDAARLLDESSPSATYVACHPNGRWLAASTWEASDGLRLLDAQNGRLEKKWDTGPTDAAFSPDGRWLALGTGATDPDGAAFSLWKVGSWELVHRRSVRTSSVPCTLTFSADSRLLAFRSALSEVTLLDPATCQELATLPAPEPDLLSLPCFSPDGRWLAWGAPNGPVHLWDLTEIHRQLRDLGLDWELDNSGGKSSN